jgi:D-alanine-D-alanine ligase
MRRMSIGRNDDGFLRVENPDAVRVLFMAQYAPDAPDFLLNAYGGDGGYPEYHFKVYERLKRLGFRVSSTSKPYAIVHSGGAADFVFSLFNRMPIRNSEVFVSSYCEYLGVPYLGAPPNVRATAEDKCVSKLMAQALGIPVPRGVAYGRNACRTTPPPFPGPYFIKDRFGAGSEGITPENVQDQWIGARGQVESLLECGTEALVEEFIGGIDITVPVIGDNTPRVLGIYEPLSDKRGHILTHDLKLTDHLGYREIDVGITRAAIESDVRALWATLGPIDYFRLDYRWDPRTGERMFLELNICCYIGEHSPFGLAARRDGANIESVVGHVVAFSLLRQTGNGANHRRRIL